MPNLIEEDFEKLVPPGSNQGISREQITHWSIHPGGKRILEAIEKSLSLPKKNP